MFRPNGINELRTAAELLTPTTKKYNGVTTKIYPETGEPIFINFKSKGGTDSVVNGVYSVINTAEVVTWYRDDIRANCRIKIGSSIYEIKGEPEVLTPYVVLKVEKIGGGA